MTQLSVAMEICKTERVALTKTRMYQLGLIGEVKCEVCKQVGSDRVIRFGIAYCWGCASKLHIPFESTPESNPSNQWDAVQERADEETNEHYRRVMLPNVKKEIQEFKEEIGNWGLERRWEYLVTAEIAIELKLVDLRVAYELSRERGEAYSNRSLLAGCIESRKAALEKVMMERRSILDRLNGRNRQSNGVTDAMIERAREYPIEKLIEVNQHGMAHCFSGVHADKKPSMDCRNGFAYCYACGFKADVIGTYMQVHNVDFKAAVQALQ